MEYFLELADKKQEEPPEEAPRDYPRPMPQPKPTSNVCDKHLEIFQGMCAICGHILTESELTAYRNFAILANSSARVQQHIEYGQSLV